MDDMDTPKAHVVGSIMKNKGSPVSWGWRKPSFLGTSQPWQGINKRVFSLYDRSETGRDRLNTGQRPVATGHNSNKKSVSDRYRNSRSGDVPRKDGFLHPPGSKELYCMSHCTVCLLCTISPQRCLRIHHNKVPVSSLSFRSDLSHE